ncbi:uncharacterized protein LOC130814824 [Amaranthus tricolor]|uniref:uncharacterized protein LOC130814824 n=1 Tax=Amaranthus tricolor TaxID=29722 RepID=UPI0025844EAF|nr:uncharacterized protein LOC130814824 [Amaranthus tricolor]
MAHQLSSKTLTKLAFSSSSSIFKLLPNSLIQSRNFATKPRLLDVDLKSLDAGIGTGDIEDAIHNIVALRLAPDWLVFVPGSSYWVPPKPPALTTFVQNFSNSEDSLFVSSRRNSLSSSFFSQGSVPEPNSAEVEVHVIVPGKPSSSDEEE